MSGSDPRSRIEAGRFLPSSVHAVRAVGLAVAALVTAGALSLGGQRPGLPVPMRVPGGGLLEASGVVAVPGATGVLVVDDGRPREVFWMPLDANGVGAPLVAVSIDARVPDLEDITTDGRYFYAVGSQSQTAGRRSDGLVRFTFDASSGRAGSVERVRGLEELLLERVGGLRELVGGRRGPLNIEGLVYDAARNRLLVGLRSPQSGRRACLVALRILDTTRPLSNDNLVVEPGLITVDLDGLAIRGLGYDASSNRVLMIGGGATDNPGGTYRLFEWDGGVEAPPRLVSTLRSLEKPEGVTRIAIGGWTRTLVVFDLGGYLWMD